MTNASEGEIYAAIWKRIDALRPVWDLKKLGVDFDPKSKPWMELTFLTAPDPEFAGFGNGRFTRDQRIFQVDLHYPKIEKRTDLIFARADAVQALFWPGNGRGLAVAVDSGAILEFTRKPVIGQLFEKGASHLKLSVVAVFSTQWSPDGT